VRDDERTKLVILNGEVGGDYERRPRGTFRETKYPKPVIARITGIGAQNIFPRGSRMGHAGAIIGEGASAPTRASRGLRAAGVKVAKTSEDLVTSIVSGPCRARSQDFEGARVEGIRAGEHLEAEARRLEEPGPRRGRSART